VSDIAVKVAGIGKHYQIGMRKSSYKTFRETLTDTLLQPFRRVSSVLKGQSAVSFRESFWALRDVSFDVKHGEVVGIIGHNGAGKSTLLKILSQITEPSEGYAEVTGRVGALLEVGTGFHPELTGRENIYLNGSILGMSRNDIDLKFDEIVDFAGIEKFIETPVKHYSSGMGLRLGFAVAAHLEPDILIVDEVLAVGDAQFQKRCLNKMSSVASEGRTVLFVSHNMGAVQSLCSRSICLGAGGIVEDGETQTVVAHYLHNSANTSLDNSYPDVNTAPGNDVVRLKRARIIPINVSSAFFTMVTPIQLEFEYWNLKPNTSLNLSLHVYNEEGIMAFNTAPVHDTEWINKSFPQGMFRTTCSIPPYLLNSGYYRVELLFVENQSRVIYRMDNAIVFDVVESPEVRGESTWFGKWPGVVHPRLEWETVELSPEVDMGEHQ